MKKDTYIFVRNDCDLKNIKKLVSNNKINLSSSLFVLWNNSMAPYFQNTGDYILLEQYSEKFDLYPNKKKTMDFIKNFPHKKILDNKSLVELLKYKGYSLWWFVRQGFFWHCIRVIKETLAIKSLIKNKKINKIMILNDGNEFVAIVKEAARSSKIKVEIIKKDCKPNKGKYLKNKKDLVLNYFPRFIRIFQGFFRSLRTKNNPGANNIILVTQSHIWTSLAEKITGDPNSYTILRDMIKDKKYNVLPIDLALNKDAAWRGIKEKKKPFLPFDYFIFKSFFDPKIRKNLNSLRTRLNKLAVSLDKSSAFKKALTCSDISLYDILKPQINNYFFNEFDSFIGAARNFEIGKKLLKDYSINAAICLDENGTSRFLVFAADSCKIPSVGLQHGIIPPLPGSSYNYSKKDLYSYKNNLNCLLPDKTAVFGNYFRNLLVKYGNYDSSKVAVTGQPRMDILFEQRKNYSKKNLCKKLGIDAGKKLVVYASQPFKEESIIAFSALVKSLKRLKNTRLLIKLHPVEGPSQCKTLLQKLKYDAIISRYTDLYEMFSCSDLVICIESTVILEALALEKQVIQLNLAEKHEVFGELASKCINRVTKENELYGAIKGLLYNRTLPEKLSKERKKFILEYYYKIDGNSTTRFIGLVESALAKK
jgi:hypothetical protein|tara:strand:- start:216 stop:2165 length:1950 start_codon:yes stop_codon:yes gene_type:complete